MPLPATNAIGYTVLDDAANWVRDTISSTPYLVLILIAGVFVALFLFGLVKKLVVFSVVVAVLALVVIGLWVYAGQSLALT
ncbi:MAG: hypothetical protein ACOYD0_08865 [Candidatus Nanopelagicales bacterium]